MKKILYLLFAVLLVHLVAAQDPASIQVTLLSQDPSPAHAADIVEVRLRVQNIGGTDVSHLQLRTIDSYPFTSINDATEPSALDLGTISASDQGTNYVSAKFKMAVNKDVPNGVYNMQLEYSMNGVTWVPILLPVEITGNNFAQISIDKSSLQPGEETPINFVIANTGKAPIQNLKFFWTNPDGVILPVYSDNTKYISYLDVGNTTSLNYVVVADVNAKPGLYKLNLNLEYTSTDNSSAISLQTAAGITIGGQTDFDVSFSESSAGQTSLAVANIGNNPALSVSVRVPDQPGYRVSGSPTAIIGNLATGDYTIVSFQIVTSNTTASNATRGSENAGGTPGAFTATRNFTMTRGSANGLVVFVDYTDTTGKRQTVQKVVPIQFRSTGLTTGTTTGTAGARGSASTTSSSSIFTNVYFIGAVIIVIAGGVWYWRKHKKVARSR